MLLGIALLAAGLSAPVSSISVEVTGTGRPMILIPGFVSSGDVWKGSSITTGSVVPRDHRGRVRRRSTRVAGRAARLRDDIIAYAGREGSSTL